MYPATCIENGVPVDEALCIHWMAPARSTGTIRLLSLMALAGEFMARFLVRALFPLALLRNMDLVAALGLLITAFIITATAVDGMQIPPATASVHAAVSVATELIIAVPSPEAAHSKL